MNPAQKIIFFLGLLVILVIFLFLPKKVFAVSVVISNAPATISEEPFLVDVQISGAQANTTNYLRGDLYVPGTTNYFGYTFNETDWYSGSDYTQFFRISIDSDGGWAGILQGKLDSSSPKYKGPGSYNLKVRRYTAGGSYTWSNEVSLTIVGATPTPTPTSTPTPTPTPTSTPTPTPTPTSSPTTTSLSNSSGSSEGSASAPVCSDTKPGSAPTLLSATPGVNQVTLTWSPAADAVTYYLVVYGTSSGNYTFGNPNVGGRDTRSYTVTNLSGGVPYYFVVRAGNGCMPGDFSNELKTATTGFSPGVLGTKTEEEKIISEATEAAEAPSSEPEKEEGLVGKAVERITGEGGNRSWLITSGIIILAIVLYLYWRRRSS